MDYQPFVHLAVVELLYAVKGARRREIFSFLGSLRTNPFQAGDFQKIVFGREIQIKVFGRYSVFYWCDHAAKEARIVELLRSDR